MVLMFWLQAGIPKYPLNTSFFRDRFILDLKEIGALDFTAEGHWYYESKALALQDFLGPRKLQSVLDIGSGSAFFSKYLLDHSEITNAICVDTSYPKNSHELWHGKSISYRNTIESTQADLVLLMDVLEHVDDDLGLLTQYIAMAPRGSVFVITVPAFQFMWSGHDEFLGHKRRYTLKDVNTLCSKAGLKIHSSGYFFALIFPLALFSRLLTKWLQPKSQNIHSQLKRHHRAVNFVLKTLCRAELWAIGKNKLFGLSVFAIGTKV